MRLLFMLYLACYNPNATFYYNDIRGNGVFRATPIGNTSASFKLCQELYNHFFRLEIEFNIESDGFGRISYSKAYSEMYLFDLSAALEITVVVSLESQNAARATQISSFVLHFSDINAEIRQTIASYSISAFEFDKCLYESTIRIHTSKKFSVFLKTVSCELIPTVFYTHLFNGTSASDSEKNESVVLEVDLDGIGRIRRMAGLEVIEMAERFSTNLTETEIDLPFTCDELPSERIVCEKIIEQLINHPLYKLYVRLIFGLINPRLQSHSLIMNSIAAAVQSPKYEACYLAEYSLTSNNILLEMLFYNGTECQSIIFAKTIVYLTLQQYAVYDQGVHAIFEFAFSDFSSSIYTIGFECDNYSCGEQLTTLAFGHPIAKLRLRGFDEANELKSFVPIKINRAQDCFDFCSVILLKGQNALLFNVRMRSFHNPACQYYSSQRSALYFSLHRRLQRGGVFDRYSAEYLCSAELIDTFSVSNESLQFSIRGCDAYYVAKLIYTSSLTAKLLIDDMQLTIIDFENQIFESSNIICTILTLVVGIIGAAVGFSINWFSEEILACACLKHAKARRTSA